MDKRVFHKNDRVQFVPDSKQAVNGSIITIYDNSNALLYLDKPVGWSPATMTFMPLRLRNVLWLCLQDKFGKDLAHQPIFYQKRFACATLQELTSIITEIKEPTASDLERRRHLYLTMARHYLRAKKYDGLPNLCDRIIDLQKQIDLQ